MTFIYNYTATIFNLFGCASSVVHEFLSREGPELLHMRIKHLIKLKRMDKAAILAKICAEFPEFGGKKNFKQIYLVCLCEIKPQQELMQEVRVFFKISLYCINAEVQAYLQIYFFSNMFVLKL